MKKIWSLVSTLLRFVLQSQSRHISSYVFSNGAVRACEGFYWATAVTAACNSGDEPVTIDFAGQRSCVHYIREQRGHIPRHRQQDEAPAPSVARCIYSIRCSSVCWCYLWHFVKPQHFTDLYYPTLYFTPSLTDPQVWCFGLVKHLHVLPYSFLLPLLKRSQTCNLFLPASHDYKADADL